MFNMVWMAALVVTQASPQRVPGRRPIREVSSWVGLGGGAQFGAETRGAFDGRLGADVTWSVCRERSEGCTGNTRWGGFAELGSTAGSNVAGVAGAELLLGALPEALRMFFYTGEGVFAVRLGAGYVWRSRRSSQNHAPIASATLTYGYRAPFSLHHYDENYVSVQAPRPGSRYMLGVRMWLNGQADLTHRGIWQVTSGIEFEPVGALRFLTGIGY